MENSPTWSQRPTSNRHAPTADYTYSSSPPWPWPGSPPHSRLETSPPGRGRCPPRNPPLRCSELDRGRVRNDISLRARNGRTEQLHLKQNLTPTSTLLEVAFKCNLFIFNYLIYSRWEYNSGLRATTFKSQVRFFRLNLWASTALLSSIHPQCELNKVSTDACKCWQTVLVCGKLFPKWSLVFTRTLRKVLLFHTVWQHHVPSASSCFSFSLKLLFVMLTLIEIFKPKALLFYGIAFNRNILWVLCINLCYMTYLVSLENNVLWV